MARKVAVIFYYVVIAAVGLYLGKNVPQVKFNLIIGFVGGFAFANLWLSIYGYYVQFVKPEIGVLVQRHKARTMYLILVVCNIGTVIAEYEYFNSGTQFLLIAGMPFGLASFVLAIWNVVVI